MSQHPLITLPRRNATRLFRDNGHTNNGIPDRSSDRSNSLPRVDRRSYRVELRFATGRRTTSATKVRPPRANKATTVCQYVCVCMCVRAHGSKTNSSPAVAASWSTKTTTKPLLILGPVKIVAGFATGGVLPISSNQQESESVSLPNRCKGLVRTNVAHGKGSITTMMID